MRKAALRDFCGISSEKRNVRVPAVSTRRQFGARESEVLTFHESGSRPRRRLRLFSKLAASVFGIEEAANLSSRHGTLQIEACPRKTLIQERWTNERRLAEFRQIHRQSLWNVLLLSERTSQRANESNQGRQPDRYAVAAFPKIQMRSCKTIARSS